MNAIQRDEPASQTTAAIAPKVGGSGETRVVAGVLVPDTPLITSAIKYARENSEPYLFNHVMRSWLFAVSLPAQRRAVYDREVLAHCLRVGEHFRGCWLLDLILAKRTWPRSQESQPSWRRQYDFR